MCATNYLRLSKLYDRLPNVKVTCFKLDPKTLDIGALLKTWVAQLNLANTCLDLMLTLMNVDESGRIPLYMAQIQNILRHMATHNENFDYHVFKQYVRSQRFDATQRSMLDLRLGILESFLDLDGTSRDTMPFKAGEITIMDMSCPFIDANTACIMFKCGLQRYLSSDTAGKLVVLDEAHKVCELSVLSKNTC